MYAHRHAQHELSSQELWKLGENLVTGMHHWQGDIANLKNQLREAEKSVEKYRSEAEELHTRVAALEKELSEVQTYREARTAEEVHWYGNIQELAEEEVVKVVDNIVDNVVTQGNTAIVGTPSQNNIIIGPDNKEYRLVRQAPLGARVTIGCYFVQRDGQYLVENLKSGRSFPRGNKLYLEGSCLYIQHGDRAPKRINFNLERRNTQSGERIA